MVLLTSFCSECLYWLKPFYSHYVHNVYVVVNSFFYCSMERFSYIIGFGSLNLLESRGVQCTSTFLILKLSQCDKAREISHCSAVYLS